MTGPAAPQIAQSNFETPGLSFPRNNYRRFLLMTPAERARFLENYRRWRALSPAERTRLRQEGLRPAANKPAPKRQSIPLRKKPTQN